MAGSGVLDRWPGWRRIRLAVLFLERRGAALTSTAAAMPAALGYAGCSKRRGALETVVGVALRGAGV